MIYKGKDSEKYDPFLTAVKIEKTKDEPVIVVWANYFFENMHRLRMKNSRFLEKLIRSKNLFFEEMGITLLIRNPRVPAAIKNYCMPQKGYEYVATDQPTMNFWVKKEFEDKEKKDKTSSEVETKATTIPLPVNLAYNSDLINSFNKMTPDHIRKARPLILSLYSENWLWFLLYSLIAGIGWILFFLIVISREKGWCVVVTFVAIFIFLVLFELADLILKGFWEYITNKFNFLDAILYLFGLPLVYYVTIQDQEFLSGQFPNLFAVVLLHLALTRIVSLLRIFRPFRDLILMILKVYIDILPFVVVLAIYIAGTGWILMLVDVTNSLLDFSFNRLWKNSDIIYNWGDGNWEINFDEINGVSWGFYLANGVFMLILFNLLIAIINKTYEEHTDNREFLEAQDVLNMLSAMGSFLKFCSNLLRIICKTRPVKTKYFYFVVPKDSEDKIDEVYDLQTKENEDIEIIMEKLTTIDDKFQKLEEKIQKNNKNDKTLNEDRYNKLISQLEEISKNVGQKNFLGF